MPEEPLSEEVVRARSLARYCRRAATYDSTCGPTWPIRERAVASLHLQPGQAVLDVACGTGLSLPLLRAAVGETGRVYGFDQSPAMLAQAFARSAAAGWRNVHLFETAAHTLTPAYRSVLQDTFGAEWIEAHKLVRKWAEGDGT